MVRVSVALTPDSRNGRPRTSQSGGLRASNLCRQLRVGLVVELGEQRLEAIMSERPDG
jgi:hypothetical protein